MRAKSSWLRAFRRPSSLELRCRGLLFDLDGTLIDSLHAVDRAWTTWLIRHNLDVSVYLPRVHGRKAIDSVRDFLPGADAEAETLALRELETMDTRGVGALPGAIDLLKSLPSDRWGIVTSGTSDVARARLAAARIPLPEVFVFGEDVAFGKPHPEPYLLGSRRLGFEPHEVVAFEDTAAGIQSILAAGLRPVSVSFAYEPVVYDYRSIAIEIEGDELLLRIPS